MARELHTRIAEAFCGGVYILEVTGYSVIGASDEAVRRALQYHINAGVRYFIVDLTQAKSLDSSAIGTMVSTLARLKLRSGRIIYVNPSANLRQLFKVTRLDTILEVRGSVKEALSSLLGRKAGKISPTGFEEIYRAETEEKKWFYTDKTEKYKLHESTGNIELDASSNQAVSAAARRVPLLTVIVATAAALILFLATLASLVWASKEIPSLLLLTLIFSVSIIFEVNLAVFILVVTGSLSEKTAQRVMETTLGKVPGLKLWVPKVLNKPSVSS
jgi:anti-anti-sigma factor